MLSLLLCYSTVLQPRILSPQPTLSFLPTLTTPWTFFHPLIGFGPACSLSVLHAMFLLSSTNLHRLSCNPLNASRFLLSPQPHSLPSTVSSHGHHLSPCSFCFCVPLCMFTVHQSAQFQKCLPERKKTEINFYGASSHLCIVNSCLWKVFYVYTS